MTFCFGCSSAALEVVPARRAVTPLLRAAPQGPTASVRSAPPATDLTPAEPFNAAWFDEEPEPNPSADRLLRADSGACLEPIEAAMLTEPHEAFVRQALGLPDPTAVAAMIVSPSFKRPWMFSVHRGSDGQRWLRVTKLDQDAWGAMMRRMQELQGSVVSLDPAQQTRALASISVHPSVIERRIDRETADLVVALWKALVARVQVVESDFGVLDGTRYELSLPGAHAGTVVSPAYATVLGNANSAAERLGAIVESPNGADHDTLKQIRRSLRDTLARARRSEPCVRMVSGYF
jgi:hypothetical protein